MVVASVQKQNIMQLESSESGNQFLVSNDVTRICAQLITYVTYYWQPDERHNMPRVIKFRVYIRAVTGDGEHSVWHYF